MSNVIRENFKKFPKNCIVRNVPPNKYFKSFRNITKYYRDMHHLDIIIEEGHTSFMPGDDNMEYFNKRYSELKRVYWLQKDVIGGKLL